MALKWWIVEVCLLLAAAAALIIQLVSCHEGAGGFAKDLSVDIQFPPIMERREGIPFGHLRPLGWQKKPEGQITEQPVSLMPHEFWQNFVAKSEPMVVRSLVYGAEATEKWSDVHLNRHYGHLEVRVSRLIQDYKSLNEKQDPMVFKRFLQNYRVEDWYLRLILPTEMQSELPMPHLINCGPLIHYTEFAAGKSSSKLREQFTEQFGNDAANTKYPRVAQLVEPYLWMSAGETSSLLHAHPQHNLHCVLDGRKDFILISAISKLKKEWLDNLDLNETYAHSNEWYSKIDVDRVNAFKYKSLAEIDWHWTTLRAGDCIYIPAGYLHQIRSYGRGISTSSYFVRLQQEPRVADLIQHASFDQCAKNAPLFESMSDFSANFLWSYTHGERHINQRDIDASDAERFLLYLLRDDEALHFERFENFFNHTMHELANAETTPTTAIDIWSDFLGDDLAKSEASARDLTLDFKRINDLSESGDALERFVQLLNEAASFHDQKKKEKQNAKEEGGGDEGEEDGSHDEL